MDHDESAPVICPHCLHELTWPLPVLPRYPLETASRLLCVTLDHLYVILHRLRHELEPPYYIYDQDDRRHRLLTAREIRLIRQRVKPTLAGIRQLFAA